jgi:hypothetical protein
MGSWTVWEMLKPLPSPNHHNFAIRSGLTCYKMGRFEQFRELALLEHVLWTRSVYYCRHTYPDV